jgi:hypothetical protein
VLAPKCFAQRVNGEADESIAGGQAINSSIYGVYRLKIKDPGEFKSIFTYQPLNTIHNPCHVADTANNFGLGEELHQSRELRALPGGFESGRIHKALGMGECVGIDSPLEGRGNAEVVF